MHQCIRKLTSYIDNILYIMYIYIHLKQLLLKQSTITVF